MLRSVQFLLLKVVRPIYGDDANGSSWHDRNEGLVALIEASDAMVKATQ